MRNTRGPVTDRGNASSNKGRAVAREKELAQIERERAEGTMQREE